MFTNNLASLSFNGKMNPLVRQAWAAISKGK
jgi:hypothetical protein